MKLKLKLNMNLSTFLALRNPVLNFCNYLSNGALLAYKNMCICYGKHLFNKMNKKELSLIVCGFGVTQGWIQNYSEGGQSIKRVLINLQ